MLTQQQMTKYQNDIDELNNKNIELNKLLE